MVSVENSDYSLFKEFFEAFSHAGIEGIGSEYPIMVELERVTEKNRQIIYISDAILFDILFISKGVYTMFGIEREKVTQGFFLTTTIPEDYNRHNIGRTHIVSQAQRFYKEKKGSAIISTSIRALKPDGSSIHLLYQAYYFYSKVPYESVFLLLVVTDISGFMNKHKSFHFYSGDDLRLFRFPDEELLSTGNRYSLSEFKIIELINEGLSSKEIADKLYRSIHTINTHRTNILMKAGKSNINDVIRDLKEAGLL